MILLRLHQISCIIFTMCIRLTYFWLHIYCWCCSCRIFPFFVSLWAIAFSRTTTKLEKGKKSKGSSVMKNFPSSLSVIARIRFFDLWLCGLQKSKTDCSSSGAAVMVELRRFPGHSMLSRKEEKEIVHLPHSSFLSDSFKEHSVFCRILPTCSNVFCANVPCCFT